jgi:hypothetical protein
LTTKHLSDLEKLAISIVHYSISNWPTIESNTIQLLEFAFGPRQICAQLVVIVILQIAALGIDVARSSGAYLVSQLTSKGRLQNSLKYKMSMASSYEEWKQFATELDKLQGFDVWQAIDKSSLYDHKVIKKRIADTIHMIQHGDIFNLIFRLRGGLARDQFGINHSALFSKAKAGTKTIIEEYHETVAQALDFICDSPIADDEIPTDAKLAFFNETRHAYGRTALLLSGGAYLGFYHFGLCKTLWQEGMLPRVISGASGTP